MRAVTTILWCLIAQQQQATPSASAPASIAKVTTRPVASRPAPQPSSAPATQFSPLVPADAMYKVMKDKITSIDRVKRELSFSWRNPDAIQDMPLNLKIKPGALLQVEHKDVSLDKIQPGQATVRVKTEGLPHAWQILTATAVRQVSSASVPTP